MDVIFETPEGRQFIVEIGFFDTVLEIKKKVQKYEGFPASGQKLLFDGQELADDRDVEHYGIVQDSRIQLLVVAESEQAPQEGVNAEEEAAAAAAVHTTPGVQVAIKIPVSKRQLALDVDPAETAFRLKQRIHESEGIPMNRFVLHHGAAEMQDHQALGEQGVADRAEITVIVRPPSTPPGGSDVGSGGAARRLNVIVLPRCGTKKIAVEVNASDCVGELRKELERLQGQLHFPLPADGYFFIYKHKVMDEDRSFRWHDVRNGDTVEIFDGCVTGAS